MFSIVVVCLFIAGLVVYNTVLNPMFNYQRAIELKKSGDYDEAIKIFSSLGEYNNVKDILLDTKYLQQQTYIHTLYKVLMRLLSAALPTS